MGVYRSNHTAAELEVAIRSVFEDKPYAEGYLDGRAEAVKEITGLYFFFWRNQNMGLLPILLKSDMSHITSAQYMFQENTMLTEFAAPESMRIGSPNGMFRDCKSVVRVSGLDKAISGSVITDLFRGCSNLVDAGAVNFEGVGYATNTFTGCAALEEIRAVGTINVNVSFADSPLLSESSTQSLVDHLKDLTGQTAKTLTVHATVGGKMPPAQKAAITAKNWTLVY